MADLTVKEVRVLRTDLIQSIQDQLGEFAKKTGTEVTSISIRHSIGQIGFPVPVAYIVDVEVAL